MLLCQVFVAFKFHVHLSLPLLHSIFLGILGYRIFGNLAPKHRDRVEAILVGSLLRGQPILRKINRLVFTNAWSIVTHQF
jgi:hypothetical protein